MGSCSPSSPNPPPPELARTLDLGGYRWKAVASPDDAAEYEPPTGWAGAIVACDTDPTARGRSARRAQARRRASRRCWCWSPGRSSPTSSCATTCSTTSACRRSTRPSSRRACATCSGAVGGGARPDMVEYGELSLNLETYQASIAGRPLDLTYMEYELLKFLAQNPGKVFTREMLLTGVGLRVLRRRPHGRRPRPAAAGQARRGARQPDPDGAQGRLPLRPVPLGRLTAVSGRPDPGRS